LFFFFFFQAEDGIRYWSVTGVQTCALPISQPRSDARILAQAMSMAGFEEVRRLEQMLGCDRLAETMLQAEPGWIDERSWEFWRGRLTLATGRRIPDAAPVRLFNAGSV